VFFAPTARTHWHAHDDGQLLIAVAGSGWVVDGDGPVKLAAGDMVWVPQGVRHWHGASADQFMIHTSLSMTKETDWQGAVTDEEFSAVDK
jgi:quercetin dioxygenase-like cupin family protein